jgi:hypothetical protein
MNIEDFSLKKKYSFIRFGYEISALFFVIFIITCIDAKLGILEFLILGISMIFLIFALLKIKFLIKLQFLFNKFFYYISKIINPILMIIVYVISIIPMVLIFKIYKIFPKKECTNSFWKKEKKNIKNIDFDEQF